MRYGTVIGRVLLLSILAVATIGSSGVSGQTLSTGIMIGAVVDEAGLPLNAVTITFTNRSNGQQTITRTDRAGSFGSPLLSPGHYDALFERLGYRPHRVEDILIVAGASRDVRVMLEQATENTRTIAVSGAGNPVSLAGASGPDRWLSSSTNGVPASMPFEGLGLGALLDISSAAGRRHDIQGLPATLSRVVLDGIPFVRRPRGFDVFSLDMAVPLVALSQVGMVTGNPDVEYPGASAGHLTAHTQRGGSRRVIDAYGDFASDATASGTGAPPSFSSYRAGTVVEGPIISDTATFVVGAEILRSRTPFDAFWTGNPATASLAAAATAGHATDLTGFTEPSLARVDRESAFARLDMKISEGTSISARGFYSTLNQPEPVAPWTEREPGSTITPLQRSILATATFVTRIDDDFVSQIDAGFESSRSLERPQAERGQALPGTVVVESGRNFGSARDPEYLGEVTSFSIRGTLHFRSGSHWRKAGVSAELPTYRVPSDAGRAGSFTFANAADLQNSVGQYRRVEGTTNQADFSLRRVAVFAQDAWRPSPSVEMLVGARLSSFRLPDSSDIALSARWEGLTGQVNRATPARHLELEPRFVITLTPAGRKDWQIRTGIMVDSDIADPDAIAEVVSNDGTLNVRSGLGQLGSWRSLPVGPAVQLRNPTLTVIGPDFRGPRTTRVFASMSKLFGADGGITFEVMHRKTEFLPQRLDLNVLPAVAGRDQFGRPLFGELVKTGGMLTAAYGTNRRFDGYEEVWGLQAAGESTFTGFTVTAERPLIGHFGLFGSYTYSKTEDDWLIGNPSDPFSQIAPFPDSVAPQDWRKGRSDLDVPHRLIAGAEIQLPGSLTPRIAGLFRYQTGYPFTPGFRPGVDANGDGSASNDPAFIDPAISGISQLVSDWPCLGEDQGDVVKRNACRGPDILGLDARFSMTFTDVGRYSASVVVDALNLIAADAGIVDKAVYLVDPGAPLNKSSNGTVDIPLIVNPDFGTLLTRYTAQRLLRVGVRVSF